jgi:hypothetical protein
MEGTMDEHLGMDIPLYRQSLSFLLLSVFIIVPFLTRLSQIQQNFVY